MKLRRINRGLVLGGILLAGTVGYVIYQNVQFNTYKSDINAVVESYISDACEASVEMNEVKSNQPAIDVVNKYWSSGGQSEVYSTAMDTKSDILSYLSGDYEGSGHFESIDYYIADSDIQIQKYGGDGAYVTLTYTVNMVFSSNPYFFNFECDNLITLNDEYYDGAVVITFDEDEDENEESDDEQLYKIDITFYQENLVLELDDGEWKIVNSIGYGWWSDNYEAVDASSEAESQSEAGSSEMESEVDSDGE